MVRQETSDEKIVPNEDSEPVSDHTLHSQLVIPVSWLGIVGMYKRFLPITLYHVKRGPIIRLYCKIKLMRISKNGRECGMP